MNTPVAKGAIPATPPRSSTILQVSDEGNGSYRMLFSCPGCGVVHGPRVGPMTPNWEWNGDMLKPTFSPSLLVTWDQMSPAGRERIAEFRLQHGRLPTNEEEPFDQHMVCHSFIVDGCLQFLNDCTHPLAGKTVQIPPFEW